MEYRLALLGDAIVSIPVKTVNDESVELKSEDCAKHPQMKFVSERERSVEVTEG